MNKTIEYYNNNASEYYDQTAAVDLHDKYERFLRYIPEGGRIMDVGCGSGRDAAAFCRMGYDAEGLDAAEGLAAVARAKQNIDVTVCDMEDWVASDPYDGIWCCAVLLHLEDDRISSFFSNLKYNLKEGGAIFISVKTGIPTGYDEKGRYMRGFTREELGSFIDEANSGSVSSSGDAGGSLKIAEEWETEDGMNRAVKWLNVIVTANSCG